MWCRSGSFLERGRVTAASNEHALKTQIEGALNEDFSLFQQQKAIAAPSQPVIVCGNHHDRLMPVSVIDEQAADFVSI